MSPRFARAVYATSSVSILRPPTQTVVLVTRAVPAPALASLGRLEDGVVSKVFAVASGSTAAEYAAFRFAMTDLACRRTNRPRLLSEVLEVLEPDDVAQLQSEIQTVPQLPTDDVPHLLHCMFTARLANKHAPLQAVRAQFVDEVLEDLKQHCLNAFEHKVFLLQASPFIRRRKGGGRKTEEERGR